MNENEQTSTPRRPLKQWWELKLNGALRRALLYHLPIFQKSVVVNEYPKSGGTWLSQLVSAGMNLPFTRNRFPCFGDQVFHGHYLRRGVIKKRMVILWRDGRDVLVSYYYHCLFYNGLGNDRLVDRTRKALGISNVDDVKGNLPSFLEYLSSRKASPRYTWGDFVDSWWGSEGCLHIKYEELFDDPKGMLREVLAQLGVQLEESRLERIVARYDLNAIKKRQAERAAPQDYQPFVRKGGYGGWKDVFSSELASRFHELQGKQLIRLGYEESADWVDLLKAR